MNLPRRRRPHRGVLGLIVMIPLVCTGCGVELAVLGAAASAASSGSAVFKRGKLNASWMSKFDAVVAAGEVAGTDLGLLMQSTSGNISKGDWETVFRAYNGDRIVIRSQRRTPQLTEFQIDVGWFGSEPTARLLLKRMAVAINLDLNRDGSGEVFLPPAPLPPEPTPAPEEAAEPAAVQEAQPDEQSPADDETPGSDPPESGRGGGNL